MARQRPSINRQDPEDISISPVGPSAPRSTRSSARLATDTPLATESTAAQSPSRKRKAPVSSRAPQAPISPRRRSKRQKTSSIPPPPTSSRQPRRPDMSQPGPSRGTGDAKSATSPAPSRRRSARNDRIASTQSPPPRRQRKRSARMNDVLMRDAEEDVDDEDNNEDHEGTPAESHDDAATNPSVFDEDELDPFQGGLFGGRGGPMGLQSTLRALSGMMSGMHTRLRDILANLKAKDDPSLQLIALTELSDLFLVSNEDNLSGQFSPDPYVKELVTLMQPNEYGEENPEIMLLACRSLANMMEALRGSVANVVYGGAVPVLCQKLLDIQFIDLAEQALSTLAKISVDFPASIVREGGLTACLTYLDFFPTSTQRTAVTTAANCCRNLPHDSFPVIKDVMPILLNVLSNGSDAKVVENACLCVSRIVESFKYRPQSLEALIEPEMLKTIQRLLLPGTSNLVGPHIHTQFLRVLAIVSKASPSLSSAMLKMNVVDTLYQILTGVSPPSEDNTSVKMDSVLVMQALIHRPREQIFETLNVICELLPSIPSDNASRTDNLLSAYFDSNMSIGLKTPKAKEALEEKQALLEDCKPQLRRFATVMFPTLTDAYSSTVNLHVRQKVLIAHLKMLNILDAKLIEDALRTVSYASFLASILSQKDHPSLVSLALRCSELLFERSEHVYQHQFHREGVISEIAKLAQAPLSNNDQTKDTDADDVDMDRAEENTEDDDDLDDQDDDLDEDQDDDSDSDASTPSGRQSLAKLDIALHDLVIRDAQVFIKTYENSQGATVRSEALKILTDLKSLSTKIRACYFSSSPKDGKSLFETLASYFDGDALESITSSELQNSGIIDVLLEVLGNLKCPHIKLARLDFLKTFMGVTISEKAKSQSTATTHFSVLIRKLQDLLSRTEHFEVLTVSHNSLENTRSNATYMLGKQLRLKLAAEEGCKVPAPYKNIMVSIHAIATFKALEDFLQPRISVSDTTRRRTGSGARLLARMAAETARATHSTRGSAAGNASESVDSAHIDGVDSEDDDDREMRRVRARIDQSLGRQLEDRDEPLECADERQISEDEDEEDDGEAREDEELNAIVDDLEDELDDEPVQDTTAVNMEVASSGKVTARKEDGTRIGTPSLSAEALKSSSAAPTSSSRTAGPSLATAGRPFASYAAAITSTAQDWHIEFSVDGTPITSDTTIYRAVHHNRVNLDQSKSKSVWSAIHTVTFKRVPGPPPPEPSTLPSSGVETFSAGNNLEMPSSLSKDVATASILRLLRVLHDMNGTIEDILAETGDHTLITPEPLSQFINTKLTAKINRQLEEPLIVASSCLPGWSEDLARFYSFLFPFETRHLFLQSTAFGYSRAMMRWHSSQSVDDPRRDLRRDDRAVLGRLQRQKVRISRARILDSAMKVMELYGSSPSVLEVEYFEEVGTGLGPTLEFYSTVSREFSKKKLNIWRESDSHSSGEYSFGKRGLFPAPMSDKQASTEAGKTQLNVFKILGKFVARSMLDSRIIDISFNPAFFRIADTLSSVAPSLGTVKAVDEDLARSLIMLKRFAQKKHDIENEQSWSAEKKENAIQLIEVDGVQVDELGLDFTLPGYPAIELKPSGSDIELTIENVDEYVDLVIDMTLGRGVRHYVEAFRTGFSQVFPYSALRAFTPNELAMLFGQAEEDWSIETLMDSIKADHGFNIDSKSVRNLLLTLSQFNKQQRRDFLQFVTGSPKLPIGGFKSLTPIFTVVCRPSEAPFTPDDYLPSVMTCVNYLKLPDYSSLEVLGARLSVAIKEGQGAFHLS